MAEGPTRITGYLDSADTRATLRAVAAVGAEVREGQADEHGGLFVELEGVGLRGPRSAEIDVGNAGTLLRIMPGWLAGQADGEWEFDGDESIRRRPVDRVADPLRLMGAKVDCRDGRLPPLRIRGTALRAIDYELPVASAQVKSCVLIAGLLAEGETRIREPHPSRDHTERMLLGAHAHFARADDGALSVSQLDELELGEVTVPGDPSSAAFWIAAAALVPESRIVIEGVGLNWTRTGFIRIAERMGAVIVGDMEEPGTFTPEEPSGDLDVASSPLEGTEVAAAEVPLAIDEIPLVGLMGVFAEGETVVRGAGELRVKESDRIAGVVEGLGGLGADIEATDDGFVVRGTGRLRGGTIDSRGDHRLAMLGAVAGLASEEGVEVVGFEAVSVSYPGFERDLERLLAG
jgi:3-phosphoshikimate 1-carboxyvinyltransferase